LISGDVGEINYVYDAIGNKLKHTVIDDTTYYLGRAEKRNR